MTQANDLQNGALILSHLSKPKSWQSLCRQFGLKPSAYKTDAHTQTLYKHLGELRRLGLIEFRGDTDEAGAITGQIRISKRWAEIQNALGRPALEGVAKLAASANGLAVSPLLGRPDTTGKPADLFVLMPFTEELRPVFDNHIKKIGKRLSLSVRRGDDIFSVQPVMEKLWGDINSARVILADCTGRNANVFYELGLSHVVGKRVILITKNKDDMPFDVKHIEFIEYKYDPVGMRDFEKKLAEVLKKEFNIASKKAQKSSAVASAVVGRVPHRAAAKRATRSRAQASGPARKRTTGKRS
jgi:hypothetical protein